ncbi:hypothetical protein [Enterococcus sp. DIV0756]|uniref:hypothetical protein n=1 Tax=Enterococcus sp. DIV0756 TaxID=2774636 RepID=UPI003F684087
MTLLLLVIMIGYHGKKYTSYRPEGYAYFTLRYAILMVSFLINGVVLLLMDSIISASTMLFFRVFDQLSIKLLIY